MSQYKINADVWITADSEEEAEDKLRGKVLVLVINKKEKFLGV